MNSHEQKKHGYSYKREDLYTCIVFCGETKGNTQPAAVKYRKIRVDHAKTLDAFKEFILGKFPTAQYMNVYGGITGDFYKRVYLK